LTIDLCVPWRLTVIPQHETLYVLLRCCSLGCCVLSFIGFHVQHGELAIRSIHHTCMHAFICLILCVARSFVVSLQAINMWKYIQSRFVLVPLIQGIQIGFYAWTLIWCIYLIASSPCCTTLILISKGNSIKYDRNNRKDSGATIFFHYYVQGRESIFPLTLLCMYISLLIIFSTKIIRKL
jgi:hypothetical protein